MRWWLPICLMGACTGGSNDPDTGDDTGADVAVDVVGYERSFGECIGVCVTTLTFAGDQVTLELREHDGTAAGGGVGTLSASALIDFQALEDALPGGLPEVSGCPDCDDGGAESMILEDADGVRTSYSWEFGNPPAEAAAIAGMFGSFLSPLSTCTSSAEITVAPDCTADL